MSWNRSRGRRTTAAVFLTLAMVMAMTTPAVAKGGKGNSGFLTDADSLLVASQPNVSIEPLLTVGDELANGYRFESLPDGIGIDPTGRNTLDIYVAHETTTTPFPFNFGSQILADFDNAQVSRLTLKRGNGKVLDGEIVIGSDANFGRFCSANMATAAEGFDHPVFFTGEETSDLVNRTGDMWPVGPDAEQAGLAVAYDTVTGATVPIPGMGRLNHENTVAVPGFDEIVMLTTDDTFSRGNSQLYLYMAPDQAGVLADEGTLYAFKADDPALDQYEELDPAATVPGSFIPVPPDVADGSSAPGAEQDALEDWSDTNGVFEFLRLEDLAYDRNTPNVVYIADTAGGGGFDNGKMFRLELDPADPLRADLSVLIDGDALGSPNPAAIHNPDNIETTPWSLMIQEDPTGPNDDLSPGDPNGTPARIWRYDLATGDLSVVAEVDQSLDPTARLGRWESSGIVDASQYFGRGAFLVDVQAHTLFIDTNTIPNPLWDPSGDPNDVGVSDTILQKLEAGQLLLMRVPGA